MSKKNEDLVRVPRNEMKIVLDLARRTLQNDDNWLRMKQEQIEPDESEVFRKFIQDRKREVEQYYKIIMHLKQLCRTP